MLGPVANLVFAVVVTLLASLMLRRKVGKRNRAVAVGFLIAVALVSFFGFRVVDRALYWRDRSHLEETPAPWMTLGYVGRSWRVPPPELARALGVEPMAVRGLTISEIARARGVPDSVILAELTARLAPERPAAPGAE